MSELTIGKHTIELARQEKVMFPEAGYTKRDVIDYYRDAASRMLPHAGDRPISMHRYPDGIDGPGFYEKALPDHFPGWIDSATVQLDDGTSQQQVVVHRSATLVYLANQACLTPHAWLSRRDRLDRPDRMILDLDPPPRADFSLVQKAARCCRDLLEDLGLVPFVQTTGSTGLHVIVPLQRRYGFDRVRDFAHRLAGLLAKQQPEQFTIEHRKDRRQGRLFVDYLRNAFGQTAVLPYSLRARPGASVATPLDWHEALSADMDPQKYTLANIRRRWAQKPDPWASIHDSAGALGQAEAILSRRASQLEAS
jgi:bifunctional non-homologous end joining protein LigD